MTTDSNIKTVESLRQQLDGKAAMKRYPFEWTMGMGAVITDHVFAVWVHKTRANVDLLLLARAKELGERKAREGSQETAAEASDKLLQQTEEQTPPVWRQVPRGSLKSSRRPYRSWIEGVLQCSRIILLNTLFVLAIIVSTRQRTRQRSGKKMVDRREMFRRSDSRAMWKPLIAGGSQHVNRIAKQRHAILPGTLRINNESSRSVIIVAPFIM